MSAWVTGQSFPLTIFQEMGPRGNHVNIVFLAEGYRTQDMEKFRKDVTTAIKALFSTSPYKEYQSFFNVFGIEVPSNESGTDHPKTADDCPESSEVFEADTYFNSTFDTAGIHRLLVNGNAGLIFTVLRGALPEWDIVFIIVNHSMYGGSGGQFAVFSTHSSAPQIAIHEIGHSFAGLADEYEYGSGDFSGHEAPNTTAETFRSSIKWRLWIEDSTPIPTPEDAAYDNIIGLFEGAVYNSLDWYRPKLDCMMRSLFRPFCAVCSEQTILSIYALVPPHRGRFPFGYSIDISPEYRGNFTIDPRSSNFSDLGVDWYLDSILVLSNTNIYPVRGGDFTTGLHQLTAFIRDTTTQVRNDPFKLRTATETWLLNVDPTLDIQNISLNPDKIILKNNYPNPFNASTSFTFDLPREMHLSFLIIDARGRLVEELFEGRLSSGSHVIRWSPTQLSSGIYFYKIEAEGISIMKKCLVMK